MCSRRFLIKLQCLKKQRLEGVRFSLPQLFENYFVVTADLQTVFSCFCLSPEGRSVAVARWQTYRLRCHTSTALLKDRERLPFSRVPLWRINDLLLRLLALLILLGGGQFNKHSHFHSQPSQRPHSQRNVPRCRCVLHSCDPVQTLFHHNNLSGEQENPNPAARLTVHAAPKTQTGSSAYQAATFTTTGNLMHPLRRSGLHYRTLCNVWA